MIPTTGSILKGAGSINLGSPRVLGAKKPAPASSLDSLAPAEQGPPAVVMSHADWERELTKARAEGARAAQEEAQAQAQRQMETDLQSRLDRLQRENANKWRSLAVAMAEQAAQIRASFEDQTTEAVFAVAVRLLGERAAEAEWIRGVVQGVMKEAGMEGVLRVLVHPDDLDAAQLLPTLDVPAGTVVFEADERVQSGGCLIEGPEQTLDARLEVQLTLLRKQLDLIRLARRQEQAEA
jgi:flagellar assembly protein FliH